MAAYVRHIHESWCRSMGMCSVSMNTKSHPALFAATLGELCTHIHTEKCGDVEIIHVPKSGTPLRRRRQNSSPSILWENGRRQITSLVLLFHSGCTSQENPSARGTTL
jgi:hypothetical protein